LVLLGPVPDRSAELCGELSRSGQFSQKRIKRLSINISQFEELLGSQRALASLDRDEGGPSHAKPLGHLLLRETRILTSPSQPLQKERTIQGKSGTHAGVI
jgi:hypothetical protein